MLSETDLQTASMVLAKCAAYDPWFPKPDGEQAQATVQAWATTFSGMGPRWLLAAVDRWYARNGAGERVLPADIVRQARELTNEHYSRLSADQKQVHAEQILAAKLEARAKGIDTRTVHIPIPDVALPEHPERAELSDAQLSEWERLKAAQKELIERELA